MHQRQTMLNQEKTKLSLNKEQFWKWAPTSGRWDLGPPQSTTSCIIRTARPPCKACFKTDEWWLSEIAKKWLSPKTSLNSNKVSRKMKRLLLIKSMRSMLFQCQAKIRLKLFRLCRPTRRFRRRWPPLLAYRMRRELWLRLLLKGRRCLSHLTHLLWILIIWISLNLCNILAITMPNLI